MLADIIEKYPDLDSSLLESIYLDILKTVSYSESFEQVNQRLTVLEESVSSSSQNFAKFDSTLDKSLNGIKNLVQDIVDQVSSSCESLSQVILSFRTFLNDYKVSLMSIAKSAVVGEVTNVVLTSSMQDATAELTNALGKMDSIYEVVDKSNNNLISETSLRVSILSFLQGLDSKIEATNASLNTLARVCDLFDETSNFKKKIEIAKVAVDSIEALTNVVGVVKEKQTL